MRYNRGPTCLDECTVGADGREGGTQRNLQVRVEEFLAWKYGERADGSAPLAAVSRGTPGAGADLLARADAICARNGLPPHPIAARQPYAIRETQRFGAAARQPGVVDGWASDRSRPTAGDTSSATAKQLWQLSRQVAEH